MSIIGYIPPKKKAPAIQEAVDPASAGAVDEVPAETAEGVAADKDKPAGKRTGKKNSKE